MRRRIGAFVVVFMILAGVGIGLGAYRAGQHNGIAQGIEQVQVAQQNGQGVQVIHVVGDDRGAFFPGFFLFPFFLIAGIFLIGGIARGAGRFGGHGPHGHGPGPWNEDGRRRFEERAREWHQHEHGGTPPAPPAPAETSSAA
jgi:hypothetical protein